MKSAVALLGFLFTCLLIGCTSPVSHYSEKGRNLEAVERFFVLRNLKDNHGIEQRIVRALKARGLEVQSGPLTLLSESAQAVVVYEDRWAWDFGDHMIYLKIGVRDPQAVFPYASAVYSKHVSISTDTEAVVGRVVAELFKAPK